MDVIRKLGESRIPACTVPWLNIRDPCCGTKKAGLRVEFQLDLTLVFRSHGVLRHFISWKTRDTFVDLVHDRKKE